MAEWLKGATLVEDTPSWLSSATLVQDRPGAFEGLGAQVLAGVGDTIAGKGMTAKELGATTVGPSVQKVGDVLRGDAVDPTQRFTNPLPGDTTIGGYSVDAAPALVARGVGNVVGELPSRAAGATIGGMVAGPVGAAAGAFAGPLVSGAASTFGPELEARRQRNNGEVGTADYLAAGGSALAQGALNALGLRSIRAPVGAPAGGVMGAAGRVAGAAGTEGATSVGENIISELATNIGTKNSELSEKSLIDAAVTGAVQGAGTGGTVRGTTEVARAPRVIAAERTARQLDYREELPGMVADFQKIATENGLNVANASDAKRIFEIYEANVNKHKDYNDQAVNVELKKQVAEGRLSQEDADKARAALDKPNAEGFSILQRAVGEEPFGVNAMALAKRAVNARQARSLSGIDDSSNEVRGPLSRTSARIKAAVIGAGAGAVLPTTFMSSIQGSGLAATLASAGHVAPIVGLGLAGYLGVRALDKALGTNNPINQLVEAGARKGASSELPGKNMESPRAAKELEEARRTQAMADGMRNLRMENLTLRNDALAQMNQLRPTVVEAQNAERQARAARSQAQAEAVPILTAARQGELNAKAQAASQVAQARADATTQVATARANEAMSRTRVNEIKAEIALLRKQKLEATSKRDKKTITGQIKNLEKTLREAQAKESVGEGVLSGQEQPASDTPFTEYGNTKPITNWEAYLDKTDTRSVTKVQATKEFTQRDDLPQQLRDAATRFVTFRSRQSARAFLSSLTEQFPAYKDAIMDHFDLGGVKGKNSVVNRVWKYTSDEAADNARARKSKD